MQHGYEMQRLQRERASEEEVNRHLRLEIETLRSPKRIEEMAIKDLKLVAPARDQAIVIERVTPAAPPDKSIVAGALSRASAAAGVTRWRHAAGTAAEFRLRVEARDPRSARGVQHGELPHAPTPTWLAIDAALARLIGCARLFVLWTVGIEARLVYLQVIEHAEMQARADRQQHAHDQAAPAKRGEIVDRNGQLLAYSVDADTIVADPSEIEHPDKVAQLVCGALDDCERA